MRPEDLARELGIDGKRLRGWFRQRWPRRPEEHGLAWFLTDEQVAEAQRAFADVRPRSSPAATVRPAPQSVTARRAPRSVDRPAEVAAAPRSKRLSWPDLQRHADAVLASGLRELLGQRASAWGQVDIHDAGVYVVMDEKAAAYVGESTSVSGRLGQHFDPESRFMAAYRASGIADPVAHASAHFRVRSLPAEIGRLELEEFAIACLRPSANVMRRTSRTAAAYADADPELWRRVQGDCTKLLGAGVGIASDVAPIPWRDVERPAGAGVYILRDAKGRVLYIGESDDLAERLGTHGGPRSYFSAFRRHVGTELLGLAFVGSKRRDFSVVDEASISAFLATCTIAILPLSFGRWELERELIHELGPVLNREHARPI